MKELSSEDRIRLRVELDYFRDICIGHKTCEQYITVSNRLIDEMIFESSAYWRESKMKLLNDLIYSLIKRKNLKDKGLRY